MLYLQFCSVFLYKVFDEVILNISLLSFICINVFRQTLLIWMLRTFWPGMPLRRWFLRKRYRISLLMILRWKLHLESQKFEFLGKLQKNQVRCFGTCLLSYVLFLQESGKMYLLLKTVLKST